ncbi:hypothetical protein IAR55_000642 [Kwoniella newhampshirensis]|uniref:RNA polymerase II subunit B1 CTD phosphatase RPAP2 homolog n=1 Tax=Kwoniella newhampshirensis TaxID=1651941 RepID=A0AAW0Z756_9TREE
MPIAIPNPSTSTHPAITLSPPAISTTAPPPSSRNPVRLSVAQRDTSYEAGPSTDTLTPSHDAESDAYKRAAVRKITLKRKVDRWMDKLMEETVDRATFKKAASYLTPPQYLEIIHERHLNSLCSYPLCPNPPYKPYTAAKRYIISTRARTIKPSEGNEEEGFCGKKCKVRSAWVERGLSGEAIWLRSKDVEVELLEELEERGEFSWEDTQDRSLRREKVELSKKEHQSGGSAHSTSTATSARVRPAQTTPPPPLPPPPPPPAPQSNDSVSALIASLTIHERPIAMAAPVPSSPAKPLPSETAGPPSKMPSQPLPLPQPKPAPSSAARANPSSSRDARRTANALISAPTSQLASTFISAAKQVGPVHQLADSDKEEEREESDWEKDMSWGGEEDDETKALFEEARMARELVEDEEGS